MCVKRKWPLNTPTKWQHHREQCTGSHDPPRRVTWVAVLKCLGTAGASWTWELPQASCTSGGMLELAIPKPLALAGRDSGEAKGHPSLMAPAKDAGALLWAVCVGGSSLAHDLPQRQTAIAATASKAMLQISAWNLHFWRLLWTPRQANPEPLSLSPAQDEPSMSPGCFGTSLAAR